MENLRSRDRKELVQGSEWDPDSHDRKLRLLGAHGPVAAAEVEFPLLKQLLHIPGLHLVFGLHRCVQCHPDPPFGRGLGAVGSGRHAWDADLQDSFQIKTEIGWEDLRCSPGWLCRSLICCVIGCKSLCLFVPQFPGPNTWWPWYLYLGLWVIIITIAESMLSTFTCFTVFQLSCLSFMLVP